MCQLLGMNANTPTDVMFSFAGLAVRAEEHKDGFGIAFFEDRGLRHFIDHHGARQSPVAELVKRYPIRSDNVIAHIRKATQGRVALENTHPFVRELWGRYWVFAHNGDLKGFRPAAARRLPPGGRHRQRTRLLLADAGTGQGPCRRAGRRRAELHLARAAAAAGAPRQLQPAAVQRPGAVGACDDSPVVAAACPPLRRRAAGRRGPARRLRRADRTDRPRGGGGDRTADHRRAVAAFRTGRTARLRARQRTRRAR
jgi:hypothetical protein